jgi:NADH dehydrogenase subunit A (EC 1.6.5.3)
MDYLGFLILAFVMLGIALLMVFLNYLLGPKAPSALKDYPYECGVPLYDKSAQATFHQGYYLLGLLLLLFDIEAAFLFPGRWFIGIWEFLVLWRCFCSYSY